MSLPIRPSDHPAARRATGAPATSPQKTTPMTDVGPILEFFESARKEMKQLLEKHGADPESEGWVADEQVVREVKCIIDFASIDIRRFREEFEKKILNVLEDELDDKKPNIVHGRTDDANAMMVRLYDAAKRAVASGSAGKRARAGV